MSEQGYTPGLEPDPESPELSPPGGEQGDGRTGGAGGALHDMGGDIGGAGAEGSRSDGGARPTLSDPLPAELSGDRPTVPTDREIDPGDTAAGQGADGLLQERLEQKEQGGP